MKRYIGGAALLVLLTCVSSFAQQTAGNLTGRVLDEQGAAVPGVTVTATNRAVGLTRTDTTDGQGIYRLNALPVGLYDVTAEIAGFSTVVNKDIVVSVSQTSAIDFTLKVAALAETVNVVGGSPLIETTTSSVGGIVDIKRIESMPLNGRQFANLAATIPGVSLGFHTDPTKSTQYSPQVNGGNGRNVNYQIDGGDNNDDTVGGLLQQFPLEAIQEFNFITQRFKAEYGRSNGGVLNVVTKSGTNQWTGSFFEMFRDKSMNVLTQNERLLNVQKPDYRRNQFGGSVGGPIVQNRSHFFFAIERTQQDTRQAVNTRGLFPDRDGVFDVPYRETLATGKVTTRVGASQYLAVRYGRNTNSQPYNAAANSTFDNWGDSENKLNSINVNHNWVLGGSRLNEFIFQYADFRNYIASRSSAPNETFPNGVSIGANANTPQTTEQKKYQIRNDFSWHASGMGGLGHDFKVGVNFINEPHLFVTFNTGKGAIFNTHLTDDLNGPISAVSVSDGDSAANIPTKQFGLYFQDDWRATSRLTLNLGLRYDVMTGFQFDQSLNPNYAKIVNAAKAGLLRGIVGLENFDKEPREDWDNIQPRIGVVYDVRGDGKDVVRGGWGIYTDFGYTNSNVLFAKADASGNGFGTVFSVSEPSGIRNPDGSFYRSGQPLSNIAGQNQVTPGTFPLFGQWVDPRLEMPYQIQSNIGWSHELNANTVFNVDFINSLGRDLNLRPRVNQRIPGSTTRRVSALLPTPLSPNNNANRPAVSRGKSEYNALIVSARKRFSQGFDFTVAYTLSETLSNVGTSVDQLNTANIQDANNPFDAPVQFGPTVDTDARHRFSISAQFSLPYGFRIAPIFAYRSALPVALVDGRDLNLDGDATEIPAKAYRVTSFDKATGTTEFEEIGNCETVNCGRGMPQHQLNLRVSKVFELTGRARIEAIGEIFNVFNTINPSGFRARVTIPSGAQINQPDPALLEPTTFSGDFRRPEQRIGQIGFRLSF